MLTTSSISNTSIRISWMIPNMPNGEITGYYLRLLDLKSNRELISRNVPENYFSHSELGTEMFIHA